jgi:hypothetical protein
MKVVSRLLAVLILLGGLAYGSYAFGRFVLSPKMMGGGTSVGALRGVSTVSNATKVATVTHEGGLRGKKPRVEIDILPADDAGPAPEPATKTAEDTVEMPVRRVERDPQTKREAEQRVVTADSLFDESGRRSRRHRYDSDGNLKNVDDTDIDYSLRDGSGQRRHRRRRRKLADVIAVQPGGTDTARTEGVTGGAAAGDGESSSSSGDTPSHSGSRSRRSEPTRRERRHESPVPRAESESSSGDDGGSSSPIPQPE